MRRAPVGPIVSRNALNQAANIGSIAAKEHDSVQVALAVIPPIVTARDLVLANPRSNLEAGLLQAPVLPTADGTFRVSEGNMTVGALDPAAENWDILIVRRNNDDNEAGYVRAGSSGPLAASVSTAVVDHGSIASLVVLEAAAAAIVASPTQIAPAIGDPVVLSPRAALPAGLALSHSRVAAPGAVGIGLANLTAGAIDPAAITWDMCVFSQAEQLKGDRSGRRGVTQVAVVDPGSIGGAAVLEVPITVPGAQIGDPVGVAAVFAGWGVGLFVSHARVSDSNTIQIGIGNLTVGAIDPGASTVVVQTFPRVPPL